MPSYESSMLNLRRAQEKWRRPRPWRSQAESKAIQRLVYLWFTCRDRSRPSGRAWARGLGISHTWLQMLVRRFRKEEVRARFEIRQRSRTPSFEDLAKARVETETMRSKGLLRPRENFGF
jgi:hypothetical protein